jgi:hypothetical protein
MQLLTPRTATPLSAAPSFENAALYPRPINYSFQLEKAQTITTTDGAHFSLRRQRIPSCLSISNHFIETLRIMEDEQRTQNAKVFSMRYNVTLLIIPRMRPDNSLTYKHSPPCFVWVTRMSNDRSSVQARWHSFVRINWRQNITPSTLKSSFGRQMWELYTFKP